jgi:hypothetical protein
MEAAGRRFYGAKSELPPRDGDGGVTSFFDELLASSEIVSYIVMRCSVDLNFLSLRV